MNNDSERNADAKFVFCLYVAGLGPRSQLAIGQVKAMCERYLSDNYELEVVDIYQQPTLAKAAQIIAVPTLIQKLPQPMRRFIGDISNNERILVAIGLKGEGDPSNTPAT